MLHETVDRERSQSHRAEQENPRMGPGRVLAEIRKFDVQRQDDASFLRGTGGHLNVRTRQEIFLRCGSDIMAWSGQNRLQMTGEVLVELQFYASTAAFQRLSRARWAAYVRAANTSSLTNCG